MERQRFSVNEDRHQFTFITYLCVFISGRSFGVCLLFNFSHRIELLELMQGYERDLTVFSLNHITVTYGNQ